MFIASWTYVRVPKKLASLTYEHMLRESVLLCIPFRFLLHKELSISLQPQTLRMDSKGESKEHLRRTKGTSKEDSSPPLPTVQAGCSHTLSCFLPASRLLPSLLKPQVRVCLHLAIDLPCAWLARENGEMNMLWVILALC